MLFLSSSIWSNSPLFFLVSLKNIDIFVRACMYRSKVLSHFSLDLCVWPIGLRYRLILLGSAPTKLSSLAQKKVVLVVWGLSFVIFCLILTLISLVILLYSSASAFSILTSFPWLLLFWLKFKLKLALFYFFTRNLVF